jgi:tetratricopeptide (TPR) repeat protein/TolB-like protein
MELLEGVTLAHRLLKQSVAPVDVLPTVKQIAAAVDAAHSANVAHGDLKPGNIILAGAAPRERVVVTDFGLSRWLPVGSTTISGAGESRLWGTPAYMAPEQLLGGTVTRATDIYALGVVMYEMVAGGRPYATGSPLILALKKLRHRPRSPQEHAKDLDPRWESVILRCLDVDPDKRFATAADVVQALEGRPATASRTKWLRAAAAAALVFALAAVPPVRQAVADVSEAIWTRVADYAVGEHTIAVLPFTQDRRTPGDEAFALGLTATVVDQISAMVAADRRRYVVPLEQVIETRVDPLTIVRQTLGATLIVTGRLESRGNQTVVTTIRHSASGDGFSETDRQTLVIHEGENELVQARVASAVADLLNLRATSAGNESHRARRQLAAERSYLIGRGHLLRGSNALSSAITALEDAVAHEGGDVDARTALSEAYLREYNATRDDESLKNAEMMIDRAATLNPLDARTEVARGRVYLATGQHRRAIAAFERALELNPNAPFARNLLAAAYEGEGDIERAESAYRAAIDFHPRYWAGYEDLGTFLYRQGRYSEAEENYVIGIGLAPANTRAIANLAAVYEQQERFLAAENELLKGLKLSPDAILYNNLGWIYILEGKFEQAVGALREAVKLPVASSIVWSSLARALRWARQPEEPIRAAYETALARTDEELRANPLNAEIRANRAYLLAETGRAAEALLEISSTLASTNARGSVTILFRAALVRELTGDRIGALDALERAARGGYRLSRIAKDPDLSNLRKDPGYQRVANVAHERANSRIDLQRR